MVRAFFAGHVLIICLIAVRRDDRFKITQDMSAVGTTITLPAETTALAVHGVIARGKARIALEMRIFSN